MKAIYAAPIMGYGKGRWWHRFYNFPKLPYVTKTLTIYPKIGLPFCVVKIGKSVYNRVGLHNIGFSKWVDGRLEERYQDNVTISLAGTDKQIDIMVEELSSIAIRIDGFELNFSCPNIRSYNNVLIPKTNLPISLKLRYDMDPYKYDLDKVDIIRLNSIPVWVGGGSGKIAQGKNWKFIKKFIKEGLNVSGCSFLTIEDIHRLEDFGCKEISIGSTILTNPKLVEKIGRL